MNIYASLLKPYDERAERLERAVRKYAGLIYRPENLFEAWRDFRGPIYSIEGVSGLYFTVPPRDLFYAIRSEFKRLEEERG